MGTMNFYHTRAHAEFIGDDLVQLAGNNTLHDLTLARGECVIAGSQFMTFVEFPAVLDIQA